MSSNAPIVILTDFGTEDPFVGIMKGVISKIVPNIRIIDLSHSIPPGDIKRAAIAIWMSKPYFPDNAIFLAVIDPGVGTPRRGIVIVNDHHRYVGPDNGLFTFVLEDSSQFWELRDNKYQLPNPGATFHGRDIFAPAAAHLVRGVKGSEFGPAVSDVVRLSDPRFLYEKNSIQGEVLFADHFGNLLTSLGQFSFIAGSEYRLDPWIQSASSSFSEIKVSMERAQLELPDGRLLFWVSTFADIQPDDCAVLVGSSGLMEIAANRSRAVEILGLSEGDLITLRF